MKFKNDYEYVRKNINNIIMVQKLYNKYKNDDHNGFCVMFKHTKYTRDIELNKTNTQKMINFLINRKNNFIKINDIYIRNGFEIFKFIGSFNYSDYHCLRLCFENDRENYYELYYQHVEEDEYKLKFSKDCQITNSGNVSYDIKLFLLEKMLESGQIDQKFYERKIKEIKFKNI